MNVQRYDLEIYHCNGGEVLFSETGDYVSHDDYAELEAKCAALAAEKEQFAVECAAAKIAIAYLKSGRQDFSLKTPATDAFLAEVREQARSELIDELEFRFTELSKTVEPPELRSGAAGAAAFVSTFRKGSAQ